MKEFIEKLIGRLEEVGKLKISMHGGRCNGKILVLGYAKGIENAIEIVKRLAEEYRQDLDKNSQGWISCSERLPETHENVLICQSDGYVNVGWHSLNGFKDMNSISYKDVIAWQPLPAPYQPKGE